MTTGQHTRGERLDVNEIVSIYEEQFKDATATDEHMHYLRAYQDFVFSSRTNEDQIERDLTGFCHEVDKLIIYITQLAGCLDHTSAADAIYHLTTYARALTPARKNYETFLKQTRRGENGHARMIKLTKTRVETRRRHEALHQLRDFTTIIPHILALLEPRLDHATVQKLQSRLAREFSRIPARALQPNTIAITNQASPQEEYAQRGTLWDKIAARFASFGVDPDMPRRDLFHLKAQVQALTSLHETISTTANLLDRCQDVLAMYLVGMGLNKNGDPQPIRDVLGAYCVGPQITRIERDNAALLKQLLAFEDQLADRHARIIELASIVLDIELLEHAVEDLHLQRHLIKRLHNVLNEIIPPHEIEFIRPHLPLEHELPVPGSNRRKPTLPSPNHASQGTPPTEDER